MGSTMAQETMANAAPAAEGHTYAPPQLAVIGRISDLTAAGSSLPPCPDGRPRNPQGRCRGFPGL
jgi:hypothetical protein